MLKWGGFLILGIVLFSCKPQTPTEVLPDVDQTKVQQIDTLFDSVSIERMNDYFYQKAKHNQFSGNVLITQKGKVFRGVYGWANYRKRDSLDINTSFQLASGSKPFTAVAIMQLVEQGVIQLDDSLGMYFCDWPYPDITVKLLLSHRSGLGNYMYHTDDWREDKSYPMCNQEAVDSFIVHRPEIYYTPDTRFDYNNTNYMLLASIIEHVSGMSFESYMQQNIFDAIGMTHTFINSEMAYHPEKNMAVGQDKRMRPIAEFYLNGTVGDKGVYSTVDDMYKFHQALMNNELIGEESFQEMITPQSKFSRRGGSYGLGFRIHKYDDGTEIVYHNGWWRGFRSYFIHYHQKDAAVIVLTNTIRGDFLDQKELLELLNNQEN